MVNLWHTSMKRAALMLLAAAVVVPAAQAAQPSDRAGTSSSGPPVVGYSAQELTAMANSHPWVPGFQARYQVRTNTLAPRELAAIANDHPHVSSSHLKELVATASSSVRGLIVNSTNVQKPASASSGEFNWGDAGIGATSGFAFATILAGTLLFLLRRTSRGQSAGTTKAA